MQKINMLNKIIPNNLLMYYLHLDEKKRSHGDQILHKKEKRKKKIRKKEELWISKKWVEVKKERPQKSKKGDKKVIKNEIKVKCIRKGRE